MNYHTNAALTQLQRAQVQRLAQDGISQSELARRFGVHRRTIQRWVGRTDGQDRSSAPHQHGRRVVMDAYRDAVLTERQTHPHHGSMRIAHDLRDRFPTANRATVWRILHAAGLSRQALKKTDAATDPGGTPSGATG
ncbi:MAG: hypothetical protein Fur005_49080 [Roseiflexaceae bacterium]